KNKDGEYSSGPMYYIEKGIGRKFKWLAVLFAFFAAFATLGIGNGVQSKTIADVMDNSFFVPGWGTGVLLVILTGLIVFGGIRRISNVAGLFAPVVAFRHICSSV